MSSEENTEALYLMFSQLLDRKLREINASPRVDDDGSDIEDDYMQEIIGPVVSASTTNIPEVWIILGFIKSLSPPSPNSFYR